MKKTIGLVVLLLVVAGAIFFFSSQPYSKQSLVPLFNELLPHAWIEKHFSHIAYTYAGNVISIENYGVSSFVEFHVRKGAHLFVFACLAVVVFLIAKQLIKKTSWSAIIALSIASGYAVFDEFHQSLTPERTPLIQDVILDTTGAALGLTFVLALMYLLTFIKNNQRKLI